MEKQIEKNTAIKPDEIIDPGYVGHCDHDPKWNTCRECNNDFCKECWQRHDEGEFFCQEM